MPAQLPRRLAAFLGLLGLVMSWLAPSVAVSAPGADGKVPSCCTRPASHRCCAGECCVAPHSVPDAPARSLPSLPSVSLRVAPDWIPVFPALLASAPEPPRRPSVSAACLAILRVPRVPLFLRDAALLI